jgi:hypothetical protein
LIIFAGFETYLKTKIEKLSKIETENLDCKSPDYQEHFSTKSFDESKASVYFTPTEGHLSPQPLQMSPIHINFINEGINGCEASGYSEYSRRRKRSSSQGTRNSFILPCDYLDGEDEENFIVPDPVYAENDFDHFQDVIETPTTSVNYIVDSSRRRKKRYKDHRRSNNFCDRENETLLMNDITYDVSKGARPKVYYNKRPNSQCNDKIGEFDNLIFHFIE